MVKFHDPDSHLLHGHDHCYNGGNLESHIGTRKQILQPGLHAIQSAIYYPYHTYTAPLEDQSNQTWRIEGLISLQY